MSKLFYSPRTYAQLLHDHRLLCCGSELEREQKTVAIVAGCTDFLAKRNGIWWEVDEILSISDVQELKICKMMNKPMPCAEGSVSAVEGPEQQWLWIGAAMTHAHAASDPLIEKFARALSDSCAQVGSVQIRNRGTLGGSICNASAAGDIFPVVLAMGGWLEILKTDGTVRYLSTEQISHQKLVLAAGEILTGILLPTAENNVSAFVKLGDRSRVSIAKINVCASCKMDQGKPSEVRIAIGAISNAAILSKRAAQAFMTDRFAEVLSGVTAEITAGRASSVYKREAVKGLAQDLQELMQSRIEIIDS